MILPVEQLSNRIDVGLMCQSDVALLSTSMEVVEAASGTRLNGTGHEHGRFVKIKFPDDREWHQAVNKAKRPDLSRMQIQHVGNRPLRKK